MTACLLDESTWTEVGNVALKEEELLITFSPLLDGEPFAKMLLLAAVVVSFPH
jgi:hypothetical protein